MGFVGGGNRRWRSFLRWKGMSVLERNEEEGGGGVELWGLVGKWKLWVWGRTWGLRKRRPWVRERERERVLAVLSPEGGSGGL